MDKMKRMDDYYDTPYDNGFGVPWEFSKTYSIVGENEPVYIPGKISRCTLTLKAISGQSKLQATTDLITDVLDDDAEWVDHPQGVIDNSTLQDSLIPVTAIRVVVLSGSAKLTIRGQ